MQLKNFNEIFHNKYFIIPSYQRGYAWGSKQIKEFWNDLLKTKIDQKYYISQITLKSLFNREYHIIDGQQRITTAIILLNSIYDKSKKNSHTLNKEEQQEIDKLYNHYIYDSSSEKFRFKYDTDNPSDKYFRLEILDIKKNSGEGNPEISLYTINLLKAKKFFIDELDVYLTNKENRLSTLIKVLTQCFLMNEYILDDNFNIYSAFESMNYRGKQLSTLELLKNRFLFLIQYLNLNKEISNNRHKLINDAYNNIYKNLAINTEKTIEDDYFLINHWLCYEKFSYNRSEAKAFKEQLLNKKFTRQSLIDKEINDDYITDYINDLSMCSEYFYILHNPNYLKDKNYSNQDHKELILYLNKLNRLGFAKFKPLCLKALRLYFASSENKNLIIELIKLIEKFIFITFGLCGYNLNYIDNKIYNFAKNLNSLDDITKTIDFIKKIMYEGNDGSTGGVYKDNKLNLINFKRYNNINGNFYRWKHYLTYLLYEYEYSLLSNDPSKTFSNHTQYIAKDNQHWVEIEHILPQKLDATKWNAINKDNHTKNLNLLGNLLLLSKDKNIKATNESFEYKKTIYEEDSESSKLIFKKLQWGQEEIIDRGKIILKFANTKWNLELDESTITKIADGSFFIN